MEILDKEAIKSILESNLIIDNWKLSQDDTDIIISISLQASYWLDEITNIEKMLYNALEHTCNICTSATKINPKVNSIDFYFGTIYL